MPTENLEEESLAKNPNLELAQSLFLLTIENNETIRQNLMKSILENNMAPFYKQVVLTVQRKRVFL